ncbi:putative membrane protein [Lewinella marina]|uniref:DUF1761 domain-containing protein n=1 Tax=Neolewinella marina TaxID=438751 RepID=A0A2G0CGH7_9BACT|nr:DUF1761 domain-containing protein [Neolewinella marina]NJB86456.1 putative membrane protein [Neolewinella marina]PHK99084.1 hypothetical protein CGL56_06380 [Neolewinella marina]
MTRTINWWAILGATVAAMFVGFLFYGALFNAPWTAAVGLTTTDEVNYFKHGTPVTIDPVTPMLINAFVMAAYALFLSWLMQRTKRKTFAEGALLGLLVGLVVAASHGLTNLFAMNPAILTIIDGSYHAVLFAIIGGIVARWPVVRRIP